MFCLERFSGYNKNLHCRKMYPQHLSLSFHQISCRRCACGRACAGGEVIKLLAWGSVQHSQTTLMPCAAICQNELWSRILLIISQVGKKKEVTDLSCFYLSISVLLSSLMCCFYSWDEQDLKGRDWFGNWAFTSIHESFFKKKTKKKSVSDTFCLFLLLPGFCCVSKALLGEIRQIPSQANSTISAAGLW